MGLLSVPVDRTPAWAKIDLQLHSPYRTWFGFGRLRCDWCDQPWGRHGCRSRASAAKVFLRTASAAQREAALDSGELTEDDVLLRRRTPVSRRRPRPYSGPTALVAALGLPHAAVAR